MRVFLILLTVISLPVVLSPSNAEELILDELRYLEIVREVHRAQENTGLVFLLAYEGQVVLADHSGLAIVEHDIPIERDSRFPVMSITKAFTGIALAIAEERGLVDLDQPISRYLTDYSGEGADEITLRMLAAHTSGIPHTGHPGRKSLYVEKFDNANVARVAYESEPLVHAPGDAYAYSSSGYNLIASVIETVSGQPYKQFVEQHVISAMGMENTGFGDVLRPVPGLVRNYSYVDIWNYQPVDTLQLVPTWDFSYNLGGGNLYSTADDLIALGQTVLERSAFSTQVHDRLGTKLSPELSRWTSGWINGVDPSGRPTLYITGATPGVQASLYVYPKHDLVFVALANCWGRNSSDADLVIGAPQRLVEKFLADRSS